MNFSNFFANNKTFRPKKKFIVETLRHDLHMQAQQTLNACQTDLSLIVKVPPHEDEKDWIAVHVVDFFNRINLIYGLVCDECTPVRCPIMNGGAKYEYLWQDHHSFKKPTKLSASNYIDHLMEWIELQINDEKIFPTTIGIPFPKTFNSICKKMLSRLFRVFVHVYIHHFQQLLTMQAEIHVNTCFRHFLHFVAEFRLIKKSEIGPLWNKISQMDLALYKKLEEL
ncbi:hypothetical protein SNEBB_004105 [Seison nebaliae]|nr:hypothetical protein SNEBB_004105 [Seison nebaliae]